MPQLPPPPPDHPGEALDYRHSRLDVHRPSTSSYFTFLNSSNFNTHTYWRITIHPGMDGSWRGWFTFKAILGIICEKWLRRWKKKIYPWPKGKSKLEQSKAQYLWSAGRQFLKVNKCLHTTLGHRTLNNIYRALSPFFISEMKIFSHQVLELFGKAQFTLPQISDIVQFLEKSHGNPPKYVVIVNWSTAL